MNDLALIKSANFGNVQCDFYRNDEEFFMTTNQLCCCLGDKRTTFDSWVNRNPYLKNDEFSVSCTLQGTDGKSYNTRVFTEDGIYEVTMLSKTEKAKEFRRWVRTILKSLRTGKAKLISMTDYQRLMTETRSENAKIRKAQILERLAKDYEGTTYKQVLQSYATKELTGEHLLPLPKLERKTYTATEVGAELGITSNMVGLLTNRNSLKTEQYGAWFNDKAKGHNKEVQSFRYYENIIPVLRDLLKSESA